VRMSEEARECERDSRAPTHTHTHSLSLSLSVRILRETNNNNQRRHRRYWGYPGQHSKLLLGSQDSYLKIPMHVGTYARRRTK